MHLWKNELIYSLGCTRKQLFGKWRESNFPKGGEKFKKVNSRRLSFLEKIL